VILPFAEVASPRVYPFLPWLDHNISRASPGDRTRNGPSVLAPDEVQLADTVLTSTVFYYPDTS
jgi:hypothetical protein